MKLLAVATLCVLACSAPAADLEIGKEVPDVTLRSTDGKEIKLTDLRGDKGVVVVLYYQSEKCPSAVKPDDVKKIADKYPEKDGKVRFIALFAYPKDSEESTKKFVETNKFGYSCVFDDGKYARHLGAKQVNTTYVLGKDGKLVYRGGFDGVSEAVTAALEGKTAPKSDQKFQG